jgi:hypothetical protein
MEQKDLSSNHRGGHPVESQIGRFRKDTGGP